MSDRASLAKRRQHILEHCQNPEGADLITMSRRCAVARRTLYKDLAWITERFPDRLQKTGDRWHWTGPIPHLLPQDLSHLDHGELLALVIARGLLRDPGQGRRETRDVRYQGPLDGAIDALLTRCGLDEEASAIAPDAIQVDRHGAEPCNPETVVAILDALQSGCCIQGRYGNRGGDVHDIHLAPLRLILLNGEYLLLANDGRRRPLIKVYRVARLDNLRSTVFRPPGAPEHIDRLTIDRFRDAAFGATASLEPEARTLVVLAISPQAWPRLAGRSFGDNQRWFEEPDDLPTGWRRLQFTTTGLPECRHWVLSMADTVRAESPPSLIAWLAEQAANLCQIYTDKECPKKGTIPL
jgi:predicted DNA-binding transcriptional regulator YafY